MKFAIVSDIHGNAPAWKAVHLDVAALGADRIICLGDTIGYGPNPTEVLESVHATVHHFVLGNHEAAVAGLMDEELFSERARAALRWTRTRLSADALRVIAQWPLTLKGPGFRCAHGDFATPSVFNYIIEPEDAMPSWRAASEPLLFVGHSHCPGIYLLGASGTPRRVAAQDVQLESDRRYLVNVGSVGQPRDGDPRASYCLYDSDARALYFRRVPYDLDAYRDAVRAAGLPAESDPVLCHDPRAGAPALRPQLGFRPPSDTTRGARAAVAVAEIEGLRRQVRAWKGLALALALLALSVVALVGAWAWRRHRDRGERIEGRAPVPLVAADWAADANLSPLPSRSSPAGAPIPGWSVDLGHRRLQSAAVETDAAGEPVLRLRSAVGDRELYVRGTRVRVAPGQRFTVEALFRRSAEWAGNIGWSVTLTRASPAGVETLPNFVTKAPNQRRRDGWWAAEGTFEIPAGGQEIELRLGGQFAGDVEITRVTLRRR